MSWIVQHLWLIPILPLGAAGLITILDKRLRRVAAGCAILAMAGALLFSLIAFAETLRSHPGHEVTRAVFNFAWFQSGQEFVELGWILDPLSGLLAAMVSFIALLVMIYSVGYMAEDENFAHFFALLSFFTAGMLGVVISNSLLLLFICWELMGLASYLLIGFWFQKPSAAAAAKKAFITTRIGDLFLLMGLLWLYSSTGTLLFYDHGRGCLEQSAVTQLVTSVTLYGMSVSTAISLLLFAGAAGKSGQFPLHVWLPDAMEGPTPVSALIHAATMVAAGVFLVARTYPLMSAIAPTTAAGSSTALIVVTWIGVITALFASCAAVAQSDIKRILAYSTVSQLGFMMLGLGTAGVAAGIFHLFTHAFFKALLFLGAGSVIHGCSGEQDIRKMGGLREHMPRTFAAYAIGMMALAGFPLFFSGFWSKEAILHGAQSWSVSTWPFLLACGATFLTAFYMARQVTYVFFGHASHDAHPHESPPVMTIPLTVLAVCAVVLGFLGTPVWPWMNSYLTGGETHLDFGHLFELDTILLMLLSVLIVAAGIGLAIRLYRPGSADRLQTEPLEVLSPGLFELLRRRFYFDESAENGAVSLHAGLSRWLHQLDQIVRQAYHGVLGGAILLLAWAQRCFDTYVINGLFDFTGSRVRTAASNVSRLQTGKVQDYLRWIGLALALFVFLLAWGCKAS